jgi:hypothetical protein
VEFARCRANGALIAGLTLVTFATLAFAIVFSGSPPAKAETGQKALILDSTVSGGASSTEATDAVAKGFTVTMASDATWGAMTAAQFADYQLVVVGDPTCSALPAVVSQNATALSDAVMARAGGNTKAGNRVLIGTDPQYHFGQGGNQLIATSIDFAGVQDGATNLYLDFSCNDPDHDSNGVPDGLDKLLPKLSIDPTPTWTENPAPPCGGDVALISNAAQFSTLTSTTLRGWGCSVHETFPTFPTDWSALAIATDVPTAPTCGTEVGTGTARCGEAYVLIAGSGIVVEAPNLALDPPTATNPVGTTHTVTATVTNPDTTPRSGVLVSFVVTGANAGATGTCVPASCTTNAAGKATFTYTGAVAGDDTINASITVDGSRQTATAAKKWVAPPAAKVSIGDVQVTEGNTGVAPPTAATFTVSLDAAAATPVSVHYATSDATATAPADYQSASGTVTFPTGVTSKPVTVNVVGDLVDEPNETFHVNLSTPVNATILDGDGLGKIIDDDRSGTFTCRASALRLLGIEPVIANNPNAPCKDNSASLLNLPAIGGLTAQVAGAATNQTPDAPATTPPVIGDRAEADANVSTVVIPVAGKIVKANVLTTHAEARCTSAGTPVLSGSGNIAGLTINGTPVAVSATGSANINLLLGVLHINSTVKTATTVTQRGIWFESALLGIGDIVVSEARAGFTGNPCS